MTRSTTDRSLLTRRLFSLTAALILTPGFRLNGVSSPSPIYPLSARVVSPRYCSSPCSLKTKASCLAPGSGCFMARSLPSRVQMTWWLKPARLCLPEKFILLSQRQFQAGINVPSTTSEPGTSSACSSGLISGSRISRSAFSTRVIVLETVG